ncbi:vacuolar fusion protein CCZ1 [Arctopsyche grandis]|uniref:vacuolar fusion protein CCZ1 n=1 Tax=Arctopsyche grandis TaxID=121162 RepID=UPI00406D754F
MIKNECELNAFFIFNSTLGSDEGQENEKILYYYPDDVDVETKKMNVGLCEAIIKFTASFSIDNCESLHTQRTRQIFHQPEKDFWMVMIVNVPFVEKTSIEGMKYHEYHGDQVQTNVLKSVLAAAHRMFRFFTGSFKEIPMDALKRKLDNFFLPYLQQLNLPYCDILNVFQGVQYLPLDRLSFLKVQCLINLIEAHFSEIKQSVFFYNDQLIWNGISPDDLQVVYKYLVGSLLPAQIENELQGRPQVNAQHFGCFISPPGGFHQASDLFKITKVHLNYDTNVGVSYLVIYRALAATVCFFIDGDINPTIELMQKIDAFVGPQLTSIASEIGEQCGKESSSVTNQVDQATPKYLYFNQLNVAYKSTVHLDNRCSGNISVHSDVLKLVADINSDRKSLEKYGEITMKAGNDYWLVGKVSNQREFYIIIQQKNANLKEIHEEVKKICDSKLKTIFFYPV